jgi:hypothetical protein
MTGVQIATLAANQVQAIINLVSEADVSHTKGKVLAHSLQRQAEHCEPLPGKMQEGCDMLKTAIDMHSQRLMPDVKTQLMGRHKKMEAAHARVVEAVGELQKAADRLKASRIKRLLARWYYGRKDQVMAGWHETITADGEQWLRLRSEAEALLNHATHQKPPQTSTVIPQLFIEDLHKQLQPGTATLLHGAPGMGKSTVLTILEVNFELSALTMLQCTCAYDVVLQAIAPLVLRLT